VTSGRARSRLRILPRRLPALVSYTALVLFLSALPGRRVARWGLTPYQLDLLHIPLFAGLAVVTIWAIVGPRRQRAWGVFLGITLFAAADEILQLWVPGRVASFADFARDALGAGIGIAFSEGLRPVALALRKESGR